MARSSGTDTSWPCLNELLRLPTVPDGLTRLFDAALQRRLADALARPHLRAQFLPGDHVVAMRQQIGKHLEHLGPQRAGAPGPGQGIELRIEHTIGKGVTHGGALRTVLGSTASAGAYTGGRSIAEAGGG